MRDRPTTTAEASLHPLIMQPNAMNGEAIQAQIGQEVGPHQFWTMNAEVLFLVKEEIVEVDEEV